MDEKFRHRLIGATVWIALAVIFFPIVFDGAGYRALHRADMGFSGDPDIEIKSQPAELRFNTTTTKLRLQSGHQEKQEKDQQPEAHEDKKPPSSSPASNKAPQKPDVENAPEGNKTKKTDQAAAVTTTNQAQTKKVTSQALQPQQHKQDQASAATRPPPSPHAQTDKHKQEPVGVETSGPWVIEAATYNDKRRAMVFINQLHQAGYPARLKPVVTASDTLFVVEIGPIERLELLHQAQNYLTTQHSIDDAVVGAAS